jgi:hypothetical protein
MIVPIFFPIFITKFGKILSGIRAVQFYVTLLNAKLSVEFDRNPVSGIPKKSGIGKNSDFCEYPFPKN